MLQARACAQLSQSILLQQKYQHDLRFERVFTHLEATLQRIAAQHGHQHILVKSLFNLLLNLKAIDAQLANIESEQSLATEREEENTLSDDRISGWNDMKLRISRHLTPQSALFRHAIRMSIVLGVGYGFIQFTGLNHGYWILLTSLFVCQPNYNATKRRLALRVVALSRVYCWAYPFFILSPPLKDRWC